MANGVTSYLENCTRVVDALVSEKIRETQPDEHGDSMGVAETMSVAVSFVGFLEASAAYARFWTVSERLQIAKQVQAILSERFLVAVETASSTIHNSSLSGSVLKNWRKYARHYAATGRPLGGMLLQQAFMRFVKACAISTVLGTRNLSEDKLLDNFMVGIGAEGTYDNAEIALVDHLASIIETEMHLLDDGSDYLQLSSSWQRELAFSVKAFALVGFLNCVILDEEVADAEMLLAWLEDILTDPSQMASFDLATATLKSVASVARILPSTASNLSRSLFRFIVQGGTTGPIVAVAAQCLAQVLNILSQDAIITTLYSLGNVLSPGTSNAERHPQALLSLAYSNLEVPASAIHYAQQAPSESVISFSFNGDEDTSATHRNVIHAIVTIATSCNDDKITALAQSMLLQKIGKINVAVDACIIRETAALALSTGQAEFLLLLRFYTRLYRDGVAKGYNIILDAVQNARIQLSVSLSRSSSLYRLYLIHLLESIINKGDTTEFEQDHQKEIILSAGDITPLLKPLALLVSFSSETTGKLPDISEYDEDMSSLFRDAWFNIAVHGISLGSRVCQHHRDELRVLAERSPPLVPENVTDILESDVELNTILRRGMSPQRAVEQKRMLINELPEREPAIKRLNYPKVVFLNAAILIESLRSSSGDCTQIISYFLDPALNTPEMASCMSAIADKVVSIYLEKALLGRYEHASAPYLSKQLAKIFVLCCHRIERVQEVAIVCASKIISESPSSLCERHSLFTLLELLTAMWSSCLEGELDEFEWKSTFTSPMGLFKLELSDNFESRTRTLNSFYECAKAWVMDVLNIAPLDIKGLLQVRRCFHAIHIYLT